MKQIQQSPSGYGECPVCHGTGWEIYRETPEGYKEPLEFTRRCSKCKGKRRINDQTGVPPEYCSADLTKFNFEAYKSRMENFRKIVTNFVNEFSRWEKQSANTTLSSHSRIPKAYSSTAQHKDFRCEKSNYLKSLPVLRKIITKFAEIS